ncbi:hypothetical protein [Candidatus Lokiarchaeum ossiferum]|uniref:hypothetical protein n=1 Tax=Candidatus Lokiarchaeum ossiferum TaxID=2951803 RepID=UPI00352C0081
MTIQLTSDPIQSYKKWAIEGKNNWVSEKMRYYIPSSMQDAIKLARLNQSTNSGNFFTDEYREQLGKIFQRITQKYHLFTDKAQSHLEMFYQNRLGIEVAHQPKFLGGERFVYNKLACGSAFADHAGEMFPFFYMADYDKVHPELIKTHFSLCNSQSGFNLSIPPIQENEYNGTRIKDLPLPSTQEMNEYLRKIEKQYKFSISSSVSDNWERKMYEERLDSALLHIKNSWIKSTEYPDIFLNIAGFFSNIASDQGYLFLSASDPDYRRLLIPHYEILMKNRTNYFQIYDSLRQDFTNQGMVPPLREIASNFIPFFYECQNPNCYHNRIQLHAESNGSKTVVKGTCTLCKNEVEFEVSTSNPDLTGIGQNLTPRVESRQYLVSSTVPIGVHIAGTGEARYYTMGIPLMKKFDASVMLPVIYFYNKTTMNTMITRNLEQQMIDLQIPGFFDGLKDVMKNVGKFNKLCKKKDNVDEFDKRRIKAIDILTSMHTAMGQLEQICTNYVKSHPETPESKIVACYLSNMFGKITKEKHGQEAVFHWIDLALKNGISHIYDDYKKYYKAWMPPGMNITF